jgi:soluble cytochrome b562
VDAETAMYWLGWIRLAQLIAVFLVAVGVVIEFAGEWVSRPLEKVIDRDRELQIAELTTETASLAADAEKSRAAISDANARAADATQRATEANLELAKFRERRTLTVEQIDNISAKLKTFVNIKFDGGVSVNEDELLNLLDVIGSVVTRAGWQQVPWMGTGRTITPPGGKPNIGVEFSITDVVIGVNPEDKDSFMGAAESLAGELRQVGIAAKAVPLAFSPKGTNSNTRTLHIIVGRKS